MMQKALTKLNFFVILRKAWSESKAKRSLFQYEADLIDVRFIASENNGYKYILTLVDCFSKKACAIPIQDQTCFFVLEALERAFSFLTKKSVQFGSTITNQLLLTTEISTLFSALRINKCACCKISTVEKFNRKLRLLLTQHFTASESLKYVDDLFSIISAYNNTVHSDFKKKYTPNEVHAFYLICNPKKKCQNLK